MSERLSAPRTVIGSIEGDPNARLLVPMERPAGLLGGWDDIEWKYSLLRSGRPMIFRWRRVMANGKSIRHNDNRKYWELARRYQTVLRNELHPNGRKIALSTVFQKTYTVLAICDYAIRLGLSSLEEFNSRHYEGLLAEFNEGRTGFTQNTVTRGRLQTTFNVLDDLHTLFARPLEDGRFLLNDGFRFACLLSADDRRAMARKGKDTGQTDDVPEEVVFAHVAAAVEYVQLYSEDIMQLKRRGLEAQQKVPDSKRARPGEIIAYVARTLLDALLRSDRRKIFSGNTVNKRKLGSICGIEVQTLYKERYSGMISSVERWLNVPSAAAFSSAQAYLVAEIEQFNKLDARTPKQRNTAACVGLPFSGEDGEFAPWPLTALGSSGVSGSSVEEAVTDLWTSCYLLILAYIAVRLEEGLTIKVDCIVERIDGPYIRYRTSKAANTEGGSLVERPCPDIVVRAVQVLTELSAEARKKHNTKDLFFVEHRHGASNLEDSTVRQRLKLFGRRTGASSIEGEGHRAVVPNEMRRFFATMWVNYYEYAGKYESLRRFLNHAWITTTVRYGLRRDDVPRLSQAQAKLSAKVLYRKLLDGAGELSNLPGSILPFLDKLRVRALPLEEMSRELADFVEDQGVELFPMAWGYCAWHHSAALYAKCLEFELRKAGTDRIDAERSCINCDGCQNLLRDHVFDPFYEAGAERHARIAANPRASRALRAVANRFVEMAGRALSKVF